MTLKQSKTNSRVKVTTMNLDDANERHLEVMGMIEGTPINVLNNDKKGAMIIQVRGSRFAIGKKIAQNIIVEEIESNE